MEEQLRLLNKLENELGIIFQEFEMNPTCVKCGHEDEELISGHEVRYKSGMYLTDTEGNDEHIDFEHLTLTCPTCGYSFRSLTKDVQEAYEERAEEFPEDEGELGEGDVSEEDGVAIAEITDLARHLAEDDSPFPQRTKPESKPKKPSKMAKIFFEEKKEE